MAHWFLKKAFSGLIEPCDWFMLQFLELEKKLYGQESAVSLLEWYKSDPCCAPAHHLAYHFYKNLVPGSVTEQLMELECISRACPDDPLVLEQVNIYLHSLEHGGPALERAVMWMRSAESDSGQESSDECPGPTNASCTLRTTGKMEVLMRCLSLLVAMLDYPAHTWDLQRWQKLTLVLTKFYQAWVHVEVISNPDFTISRGQVMCTSHLQLCHKSSEVLLSFCCYQDRWKCCFCTTSISQGSCTSC
ncbi:uncharacterized protein LOC135108577 isoform X1 [Scylla paramamosain]|uniref:uncharacterized protein LOC135108577 isoform X1 n=1 Tax=Scylla paramamosain TaxID=85552 RepID=UPI003083DB2D